MAQGQIGGARDIMAQRASCTNAAAAFDDADERYTALVQAFHGFTQQDFEDLGNTVDDAYLLADQLPRIKAILETSADWALIKAFADKTRDITRM